MTLIRLASRSFRLLPQIALVLLVAGCGSDGVTRYDVSGEVTFGGKPVPYGNIVFDPDSAAGNKGPQGAAEIREGKYDTRLTQKGSIGGPHLVRITGFDAKEVDESKPAKALFPEYVTKVDLPKEKNGKRDITVPADWKGASPGPAKPMRSNDP